MQAISVGVSAAWSSSISLHCFKLGTSSARATRTFDRDSAAILARNGFFILYSFAIPAKLPPPFLSAHPMLLALRAHGAIRRRVAERHALLLRCLRDHHW